MPLDAVKLNIALYVHLLLLFPELILLSIVYLDTGNGWLVSEYSQDLVSSVLFIQY